MGLLLSPSTQRLVAEPLVGSRSGQGRIRKGPSQAQQEIAAHSLEQSVAPSIQSNSFSACLTPNDRLAGLKKLSTKHVRRAPSVLSLGSSIFGSRRRVSSSNTTFEIVEAERIVDRSKLSGRVG